VTLPGFEEVFSTSKNVTIMRVHVHVYMHVYIYMYVCVYVCIYIYIHARVGVHMHSCRRILFICTVQSHACAGGDWKWGFFQLVHG